MQFWTLRAVRRKYSKSATLDLRRAHFGLFKDLLGKIPWDKPLEGRGAQERSLIFKDHFIQAQGGMQPNTDEVRSKCQEACMNKQGAPDQTKADKGDLQGWRKGHVVCKEYRERAKADRDQVRKTEDLLEFELARDVKGNNKSFYR